MKLRPKATLFAFMLLALWPVCLHSQSQYHSHFYVTEPKWYQAFLHDENATIIHFRESYSLELAQIHCGRKCSQNEFCEVFSITGSPGGWRCALSNSSYCHPNRTNVLLPDRNSATWDKVQDLPNNGTSCFQRSGILNMTDPNQYCPYIRPGCYGENCTDCHKSCSQCFAFKNMSLETEHECTLWFWDPPALPATHYKCYGPRSYVWVRKVDRNNGNDISGGTLHKPRQDENFTWIQNMWTGGEARFVFSQSEDANTTYDAIYKNFSISEKGTLSMSFVDGSAGDGFKFGSNIDGNISLQFIWPSSGYCGPYWYRTYDTSCPSDRVSLWDASNVSNNFFGVRWPTLNISEGMGYFRLLFY